MSDKFRKRPVVITAFQYRAGEQDGRLALEVCEGKVRYPEDGTMLIHTMEGVMCAQPGDWIIRGVNNELYPCKPDIFEKTYEKQSAWQELESSRDKIARLEAECAALKADANRYRWLREFSKTDHDVSRDGDGPVLILNDEFRDDWRDRTDAAIDEAMQAGEKP